MYIPVLILLLLTTSFTYCFNINDINTLVTFGDSYTTQFFDTTTLQYACKNCTSAGGPNWVEYLAHNQNWTYWNFAYNSAPINNTLAEQVMWWSLIYHFITC
jgi:hypothetical protein